MGLLKIFFLFLVLSFSANAAYIDEVTIGGQPISVLGPLTDAQLRATAVPISVATLPLPTGSATSANQTTIINNQTNRTQRTQITNGTIDVAVLNSAPAGTENGLVCRNIPSGTQTVSGTVTANLGTIAGVSTETTLSALNTKIPTGLTVTSSRLLVDGSGVTQPVSGTVTANQGGTWNITNVTGTVSLPTGAATSANQTNGTQKTRLTSDGTNDAVVTNAAPLSSAYALAVRPISLELATFSVVSTATTVGNNKSMLAVQNTGTSVIRIREIWIINDQNTAVTGVAGLFEVRRITSFTAGTALTPVPYDSADTLPAGITAATGSTVSGETVLLRSGVWSTDEWGPGTSDVESFDHALQQVTPFWQQTPNGKSLTIRQNQGIHVKFATNSTAGAFNIRIVFTVE